MTGTRRTEIAALRWSEICDGRIELSGERTKIGEPRIAGSKFVFTTTRGETRVSGWSRSKELLDRAAAEIAGESLAEWRLHDLCRTAATGLQRLGVSLQAIEAVLGHLGGSRGGIVGVYQRHSFADEKRAALQTWGGHVETLEHFPG